MRSAAPGKAWDFELPKSSAELARHWQEKARVAEEQAAHCAGHQAAAWLSMAEAWREAARRAGVPAMPTGNPLHTGDGFIGNEAV